MTSAASNSFSSHFVMPCLCIAKTIDGLLCLFYLYGRYPERAQHVGDTIAERIRYKQHAALEIRPYPDWNYRIPMN